MDDNHVPASIFDPVELPRRRSRRAQPSSPGDGIDSREPPPIDGNAINWSITPALSIRQPFAEQIMSGEKDVEYRSRATHIRGRIAIYASLSKEHLSDCDDPASLPRGVIVGTVELYASDSGEWYLRNPQRLAQPVKPTKRPQPVWFYPFGRA